MSLVLGIDTGGTYTDCVIVNRADKTILTKAKALTTKVDLTLGIRNCINELKFERFEEISAVSLSTTLATNAIVEGRGGDVGLIMIGFELEHETPAKEIYNISGGHTSRGIEKDPLDLDAAKEAILAMKGNVEAIAVSSYFSVRNPEHEIAVQQLVTDLLDIPVVCGHHLSRSLGIYERALTAILNARLIPIIKELIISVKAVMAENNISGALMIVKGDGSIMSEEQAEFKPIETILSGPASSVMGAVFLASEQDAFVLDMGGTTTDIAVLKNGVPKIGQKGAKVGGWPTMVEAAEIFTYGLGGDSWLHIDQRNSLAVGPKRVLPISAIADQYPYYADELKEYPIPRGHKLLYSQAVDGFMRLKDIDTSGFNKTEKKIWDMLEKGPRTLAYLISELNFKSNFLNLKWLVDVGALARISLTPTDILIASGECDLWNSAAANSAVDIFAFQLGMQREKFIEKAIDLVVQELCYSVLQSASDYEGNSFVLKESEIVNYLLSKQLAVNKRGTLSCLIGPSIPIIGIGAPVEAWLPKMSEKLGATLIIPPHPEVANAVGSATSKIMETVTILIRASSDEQSYSLHSAWEMKTFDSLNAATEYGLKAAEAKAEELAIKSGAQDFSLISSHKHEYIKHGAGSIYIETVIEATAIERPEWER